MYLYIWNWEMADKNFFYLEMAEYSELKETVKRY